MKTREKRSEKELKVFVVDDNSLILTSLVRNLRDKLNCQVIGFPSAEECLNKLNEMPALIISDYYLDSINANMMNGDKLLRKLKSIHSEIPVIIYSAMPSIDLVLKTIELGAKDFIAKGENGFEKISETSIQILNFIKKKYKEKVAKNYIIAISTLIILLISAEFYINKKYPEFLPTFFIIVLSAGILIMIINFFSEEIKSKFNKYLFPKTS